MTVEEKKERKEWIHCNECARSTNQLVVHTHIDKEGPEIHETLSYGDKTQEVAQIPVALSFSNIANKKPGIHETVSVHLLYWQMIECQRCKTFY